jgi:hypothetical protein
METIADILGIEKPEPAVVKKLLISLPNCANPDLIYGMELEIENLPRNDVEYLVPRMSCVRDDSLRNHGKEFLTVPMRYRELSYTLDQFFKKNDFFNNNNYSERCSIHVHANCTDITQEELRTILMLYQVFERVLYNFVGNERDKNIFCVPWYDTTLNYDISNKLLNKDGLLYLRHWQKYTGLNLLSLFQKGTIEFRQLHGTNNLKKILDWLNIIGCLFRFAKQNTSKDVENILLELNTTSKFAEITRAVFGEYTEALQVDNYKEALESGVITMKYSIASKKETPVGLEVEFDRELRFNWNNNLPEREERENQARNVGLHLRNPDAAHQPRGFGEAQFPERLDAEQLAARLREEAARMRDVLPQAAPVNNANNGLFIQNWIVDYQQN